MVPLPLAFTSLHQLKVVSSSFVWQLIKPQPIQLFQSNQLFWNLFQLGLKPFKAIHFAFLVQALVLLMFVTEVLPDDLPAPIFISLQIIYPFFH